MADCVSNRLYCVCSLNVWALFCVLDCGDKEERIRYSMMSKNLQKTMVIMISYGLLEASSREIFCVICDVPGRFLQICCLHVLISAKVMVVCVF